MSDFNERELAITAWAFATADQLDGKLFLALARVAERRVGQFDAFWLKLLGKKAWLGSARLAMPSKKLGSARLAISCKARLPSVTFKNKK